MMRATWAVHFPARHLDELVQLWTTSGVQIHDPDDAAIWVCGDELTEEVDMILRSLLNGKRYIVHPDGQLQSPQKRVPSGFLPVGTWVPLRDWLQVCLPTAAIAVPPQSKFTVQLIRTHQVMEHNILLTATQRWARYALSAPRCRLRRWRFACSSDGLTLIHGTPLPPLSGTQWVEREGVAIPAGYTWEPFVTPVMLAESFQLAAGDIALWHADGTWDYLPSMSFVAASREAVRATWEELTGDGV